MREPIHVARDGSGTHPCGSGLRLHMAFAVRLGATPAEIIEVLAAAGQTVPEPAAALSPEQTALREA